MRAFQDDSDEGLALYSSPHGLTSGNSGYKPRLRDHRAQSLRVPTPDSTALGAILSIRGQPSTIQDGRRNRSSDHYWSVYESLLINLG
jgi:hypothetical protein